MNYKERLNRNTIKRDENNTIERMNRGYFKQNLNLNGKS